MLTLNLTLSLSLSLSLNPNPNPTINPNICAHLADTQNNVFSEFIKGIFCARCVARFVGAWGK